MNYDCIIGYLEDETSYTGYLHFPFLLRSGLLLGCSLLLGSSRLTLLGGDSGGGAELDIWIGVGSFLNHSLLLLLLLLLRRWFQILGLIFQVNIPYER